LENIRDFIIEDENWEEILTQDPYNIVIKRDGRFTLLKYSQVGTDFSEPLVWQCRGIIFDDAWNIVRRPFDKFFNLHEPHAADIDWSTAAVTEKVDGSLIKLWNYRGVWHVSTNGTINAHDAELSTPSPYGNTFGDLVTQALENINLDFSVLDESCNYMFELVSPYNKIVVHYPDVRIVHIATRVNLTGEYLEHDIGVPKPEIYPLETVSDCLDMVEQMPYDEEGYVVRDGNWNFIKIKSPAYVAAHRMVSGGMNHKRALAIFEMGEFEEFLSYFPEYEYLFDDIQDSVNRLQDFGEYVAKYLDENSFETRKDLAQWAVGQGHPAYIFSFVDGHVNNIQEWFEKLTENKKLQVLTLDK